MHICVYIYVCVHLYIKGVLLVKKKCSMKAIRVSDK